MRDWRDREDEAEGSPMKLAAPQAALPAEVDLPAEAAPTAGAAGSEVLAWPLASPWRRWCARLFDLWWESIALGIVVGLVGGLVAPGFLRWIDTPGGGKLLGLALLPLALLLDAALMATLGNTPGKALLGLRVGLVDGRPLTFVQLFWRNVGVWAAGLGLGLPLVTLFTMARQHRRLKAGEGASYDDEGFRVRARPIGWGRRLGFGAAFLAAIALVVGAEVFDKEASRQEAARIAGPSFQWTNPGTGRTISVVPKWRYESATSEDGMLLHQFTEHSGHALVIIAAEEADGMSLAQYVRAWTPGLADAFVVPGGEYGDFRGQPSWTVTGTGRDENVRIKVRLVLADGKVWRLSVVQSPPVRLTDELADALGAQLWDTVLSPQ